MGLIIDNKDILLISQLTADAAHHLDRCFSEGAGFLPGENVFSKSARSVSFLKLKLQSVPLIIPLFQYKKKFNKT